MLCVGLPSESRMQSTGLSKIRSRDDVTSNKSCHTCCDAQKIQMFKLRVRELRQEAVRQSENESDNVYSPQGVHFILLWLL